MKSHMPADSAKTEITPQVTRKPRPVLWYMSWLIAAKRFQIFGFLGVGGDNSLANFFVLRFRLVFLFLGVSFSGGGGGGGDGGSGRTRVTEWGWLRGPETSGVDGGDRSNNRYECRTLQKRIAKTTEKKRID